MRLEYLGQWNLPRGPQAHDPALPEALWKHSKFGAGGAAMCLAGDGSGLWIGGHKLGMLVAKVAIPEIGGTAELLEPFRELAPAAALAEAKLNRLVGIAEHEGRLIGLYQEYYDTDGKDGGRVSFWDGFGLVQVGAGELKKSSGYLTSHEGKLWCGRSSGAGKATINHGPVLYEILLPNASLVEHLRIARQDWTKADFYTALVFLPGYVCWVVQKAVRPVWYGQPDEPDKQPAWFSPEYVGLGERAWRDEAEWREAWEEIGIVDPWNSGKGYHTTARETWLIAYRWPLVPNDPGETVQLEGFHAASNCGGAAYDATTGRLYVAEVFPPENMDGVYTGEGPRVHVYQLDGKPATEPAPEEEAPAMLRVRAWDEEGREYEGEIPRVS